MNALRAVRRMADQDYKDLNFMFGIIVMRFFFMTQRKRPKRSGIEEHGRGLRNMILYGIGNTSKSKKKKQVKELQETFC